MNMHVELPKTWKPRTYQMPGWTHMDRNESFRALLMWHRRSGKDDMSLHMCSRKMHKRVGNYWYMLPEAAQARKAIWTAINPHTGRLRIDEAFPPELRASTNNTEMSIKMKVGSTMQVVGSDNFSSLVGSPPIGIIFSEWALAKSQSWGFLRPILLENKGWALFNTTPRGRNHAYKMLEAHKKDPNWFTQVLSAEDTNVFTIEQLAAEKAEYVKEYGKIIGEALFEQEYLCSFDAAIRGAYYTDEVRQLKKQGRLTNVPIERLPINVVFDLGMSDDTAIWVWQEIGREIRIIWCYHSNGVGLDHYVEKLEEFRIANRIPSYGRVILPHDGKVRELGTGLSRQETLKSLMGLAPIVLPQWSFMDGINAVRRIFPRLWIDEDNCSEGVEAVTQYRRDYDERNDSFYDRPLHDWTSHYADSLRYLAMSIFPAREAPGTRRRTLAPKVAVI